MTIELITGAPGAGKTTFAVATRIAVEAVRKIKLEDGAEVVRRVCAAGFRGLVLEHERLPHKLTGDRTTDAEVEEWNRMLDNDTPKHQRLAGAEPVAGVPCLVQNWWLWCKPGDLIAVDEAQFLAPRGTLGRKPPYWIQALEIHRHYGVDFLIVTQHPQLIDTTIRALVGLHRHIRSVMGSALCMVYTWDHASNPERFTLANKSQFMRRSKHYKLFHSSVAHVKPPSSGRAILWIVPVLFLFAGLAVNHFKDRFSGKGAGVPLASVIAGSGGSAGGPGQPSQVGHGTGLVQRAGWRGLHPVVRGCFAHGPMCRCQGPDGRPVRVDDAACRVAAAGFEGLIEWEPRAEPVPSVPPVSPPHAASAPLSVAL